MAVELTRTDILGSVKQNVAPSGVTPVTSTPSLGGGVDTLGQINQALGSVKDILNTIAQIRNNPMVNKSPINVTPTESVNSTVSIGTNMQPPPQQQRNYEVKINYDAIFSLLDTFIDENGEQYKDKTIGELVTQYKVLKLLIQPKIKEKIEERKKEFFAIVQC